jgi:hypothetical protein
VLIATLGVAAEAAAVLFHLRTARVTPLSGVFGLATCVSCT